MKTEIIISTIFGSFPIRVNQTKYNSSIEKDYNDDTEFSSVELSALIESIESYPPGGLGECLVESLNKRGYKRDPNYSKFSNVKSTSIVRCPVVMLKEDFSPTINFYEHLRQFRRIRNLIASVFEISKKRCSLFV